MPKCLICRHDYEDNALFAGVCEDCHDDSDSIEQLLQSILDKKCSLAADFDLSHQKPNAGLTACSGH